MSKSNVRQKLCTCFFIEIHSNFMASSPSTVRLTALATFLAASKTSISPKVAYQVDYSSFFPLRIMCPFGDGPISLFGGQVVIPRRYWKHEKVSSHIDSRDQEVVVVELFGPFSILRHKSNDSI